MDKEWIEKTIKAKTKWRTLSTVEMTQEPTYGEAAEAITQAHEEELSEMEHRYQQANQMNLDIAGMAMIDMEKAQAQVAAVADWLKGERDWAQENFDDYASGKLDSDEVDAGWLQGVVRACTQALEKLQSAPKVLAHAELAQGHDDISETLTYSTGWEPPQDVEIHVEVFGKAQARFNEAKNIKVIILDCSRQDKRA